jgi:hypothetical protein
VAERLCRAAGTPRNERCRTQPSDPSNPTRYKRHLKPRQGPAAGLEGCVEIQKAAISGKANSVQMSGLAESRVIGELGGKAALRKTTSVNLPKQSPLPRLTTPTRLHWPYPSGDPVRWGPAQKSSAGPKSAALSSNSSYGFCERFSNLVNLLNQASFMSPVGPFRCLAMIKSPWPETPSC